MTILFKESTTAPKIKSSDSPRQVAAGASGKTNGRNREGLAGTNNAGNRNNSTATPKQHHPEQSQRSVLENTTVAMVPSARGGYQVEEYSLTLLKHKSYFNNRPLGRCLDDDGPEKGTETRVQRVRSKKETESNNQDKKIKDSVPPGNAQTASPVQQLDALMSELLTWQRTSESTKPGLDQWWESRDRDDIEGFWKDVRTQLWVDDEEIYETKIGQGAGNDDATVSNLETGSLSLKPSIPTATLHACFCSDLELGLELEPELEPELPLPPMPTRAPPPVPPPSSQFPASSPASQLQKQDPTVPSQAPTPNPSQEYLPWNDPPTPSPRTSFTAIDDPAVSNLPASASPALGDPDVPNFPSYGTPEPTLPMPPPIPTTNHTPYPSSPWTRPPTWRSPSSLRSSSPAPAVPPQFPTGTPPNPAPRPRSNHARARHRTHSAANPQSLSTAHSHADRSSGRRTTATSTSSVATWARSSGTPATSERSLSSCSTAAAAAAAGGAAGVPPQLRQLRLPTEDSFAFLAAAAMMPHPPRRRLTSEESFSPVAAAAGLPPPPRRWLTSEESFSPVGATAGRPPPSRRRLTSEESFSPSSGSRAAGVVQPPPRRRLTSEESFSPSSGGTSGVVQPPPRRRLTSMKSFSPVATAAGVQPPPRRRRLTTEDPVAVVPPPPRRRLTTEEKLWEIDAFLSGAEAGEGREGWI